MDSFLSETDLIIVFEWAAAGDLKRQLRKAQEREVRFEERIVWKYFSQIADAIQHMHEKRIMHRDLKVCALPYLLLICSLLLLHRAS
jgi:NIMA (never in mitosis gene a)-related kinase